VPWLRPSDTGRSSNCLINDVGIYIHKKERGFHNYALPYSWDVRLGHKTRDEALHELDDEPDMARVRRILGEIGYDENRLAGSRANPELIAYYVASHDVSEGELRRHVAGVLPASVVPRYFRRIDAVPLTRNGKVDLAALPGPAAATPPADAVVPIEGAVQERIAAIWREVLNLPQVGARTSFFELGGASLSAMEVVLRICREFEIDLPLQVVFQRATVADLASAVEERILDEVASLSDDEVARLAAEPEIGA
jgi:acyl carrier protein